MKALVGYTDEDSSSDGRPRNYVELRVVLNFPHVGLKLKNKNHVILALNFTNILTLFEIRPVTNTYYFLLKTRSIDIDGIYYKNKIDDQDSRLVRVITSQRSNQEIPLNYEQDSIHSNEQEENVLFKLCIETNPINYQNADLSIRTTIHSLEAYYERTSINELIRFFRTDYLDLREINLRSDVWSTAGVSYAVENHSQIHVHATLSSPYFIIPVKGTSLEDGDLIVFYLGTTSIESRLQPKRKDYLPNDIQDLQSTFYDEFSLTIKQVQAILVDSKIDWKTYLNNPNKKNLVYHLINPIDTENKLYLSINAKYHKVPVLKLDTEVSSIKVNLSDKRIIRLFDFVLNFKQPDFNLSKTDLALPQTMNTSSNTQFIPVRRARRDSQNSNADLPNEPDDEWEGPFQLPTYISGNPIPNYPTVAFNFKINKFSIDLNTEDSDTIVQDYLQLLLTDIEMKLAITKYGQSFKAELGDLKLVDKKHKTEILSSKASSIQKKLISFYFRNVEKEAPNFETLYKNILRNILFRCNALQVVCHRTAFVNFLNYAKNVTEKLKIPTPEKTEISEDGKKKALRDHDLPRPNQNAIVNESQINTSISDLNLIAEMEKFTWIMHDTNYKFGYMDINRLSVNYNSSGIKMIVGVKLNEILINYTGDSTKQFNDYYRQIISCTGIKDDKEFLRFRLTLYTTDNLDNTIDKTRFQDSIDLSVGQIKLIGLLKFVNELRDFFDPFIDPLPYLTEQMSEKAAEAASLMYTKYQENETNGRHILLNVQISSPRVIIPQNSSSFYAFSVSLGNLRVTNKLDMINQVDDINMSLENVEVKRILFSIENRMTRENIREQVVNKIHMEANIKRALRKVETADIHIDVKINNLTSTVSLRSAKLLFAILNENLNEGIDPIKELERQNAAIVTTNKDANKFDLTKQQILKIKPSTNITLSINVDLNQIRLLIITVDKKSVSNTTSTPIQLNLSIADPTSERPQANIIPFSDFQIQEIKIHYVKYEDDKWIAKLNLKKVFLDDVRPNSNFVVKQMFVPLSENDIITLTYEEERKNISKLTFGLDNLRVNLCLPYLLELYNMAMDAINTGTPNQTINQSTNGTQKPATQIIEERNFFVTANINIREMILFAEPEKKENSKTNRVLKLKTKIKLEYEAKDGDQLAAVDLTELEIILADFARLDRKGTHFVLPTESKITMQHKKDQKIPVFKAYFKQLVINMTPNLYQIVMGVINSINMTGLERVIEEKKVQRLREEIVPFVEKSIQANDYFLQSLEASNELADIEANYATINHKPDETPVSPAAKSQATINRTIIETLHLVINEFMIIFCEENPAQLQAHAIVSLQLDGKVSNWTSNLHVKADLTLEAIYYNDYLNTWEPLIETVMEMEDSYRPWILSTCFAMEPGGLLQAPESGKSIEKLEFKPIELTEETTETEKVDSISKTANYVFVKSNDILNINITPSGYKVVMYLMKITTAAATDDAEGLLDNENRPLQNIKINNYMGIKSTLWVSPKLKLRSENALEFNVIKTNDFGETNQRLTNRQISYESYRGSKSEDNDKYKVMIQVDGYEKCKLSIKTDGTYMVVLNEIAGHDQEVNKMNIVYRVVTYYGRSKVIFSSPLQIENKSKSELKILIKMSSDTENGLRVKKEDILKLKRNEDADFETFAQVFSLVPGKIYYVPCNFAYNYQIYSSPDPSQYYPSLLFDLRNYNLKTNVFDSVHFTRINEIDDSFVLLKQLTLNVKQYRYLMLPNMHCNYRILLYTPIVLVNSLPFSIRFDIDEQKSNSKTVESGHTLNICLPIEKLRNCKLYVDNYLGESWLGSLKLNESKKDNNILELNVSPSSSTPNVIINKHLKIHSSHESPNEHIFYSPYWIINKTGLNLRIKAVHSQIIFDVPSDENIVLFDIKPKKHCTPFKVRQGQNKAQIQVNNGDWSASFGLDAAGTNGFLKCTDGILNYNFLIRVTMSNSSRTKLITLAPYLMIVNQLEIPIEIAEYRDKSLLKWIPVEPISNTNKSIPFWPEFYEFKNLQFKLRTKNNLNERFLTSLPFPLENPGRFVLIMKESDDALEPTTNLDDIFTIVISGGSQNPINLIIHKYKYGDSVAKYSSKLIFFYFYF